MCSLALTWKALVNQQNMGRSDHLKALRLGLLDHQLQAKPVTLHKDIQATLEACAATRRSLHTPQQRPGVAKEIKRNNLRLHPSELRPVTSLEPLASNLITR